MCDCGGNREHVRFVNEGYADLIGSFEDTSETELGIRRWMNEMGYDFE